MKRYVKTTLLLLLGSLVLTGCNSSGFGVVHHGPKEDDTPIKDTGKADATPVSSSGAGDNYSDGRNHGNDDSKKDIPSGAQIVEDHPIVDIGSKLLTFSLAFYESVDEECVYVKFANDPLEEKYDYSYYTVNDDEVECSLTKEIIEDEELYKINLGTTKVGSYSIKFFNKESVQYGLANINIVDNSPVVHSSFISVMIGIVEIRVIAFGYAVANGFKKIGDFFYSLFNKDRSVSIGNGV